MERWIMIIILLAAGYFIGAKYPGILSKVGL